MNSLHLSIADPLGRTFADAELSADLAAKIGTDLVSVKMTSVDNPEFSFRLDIAPAEPGDSPEVAQTDRDLRHLFPGLRGDK